MQDWLFEMPELTTSAKLIMMKIVTLTGDGAHPCWLIREQWGKELGLSVKTFTRAIEKLTTLKLIEEVPNPNPWDRKKFFVLTENALAETKPEFIERDILSDSAILSKKSDNLSRRSDNLSTKSDKKGLSSLDLIDRDINSKKKESKNCFCQPSNESIFSIFEQIREQAIEARPELGRINFKAIALKFISFQNAHQWKGITEKNLTAKVTKWTMEERIDARLAGASDRADEQKDEEIRLGLEWFESNDRSAVLTAFSILKAHNALPANYEEVLQRNGINNEIEVDVEVIGTDSHSDLALPEVRVG